MSVNKLLNPRARGRKRSAKRRRRFLTITRVFKAAGRGSRQQASRRATAPVTVWDAKLGAFRSVDLSNLHDPLREPARQLASLRAALSHNGQSPHSALPTDPAPCAAAARDRRTDDPPRSPFGGGNRLALDDE